MIYRLQRAPGHVTSMIRLIIPWVVLHFSAGGKLMTNLTNRYRAALRFGLECEALEPRCLLSAFNFSTGSPDGRIATIGEPPNTHNADIEFESADDFVLSSATVIKHASFTGLLTGGATLHDVENVFITIYRVFPNDSDTTRPPQVPTRMNSPSDNEIENRDSAAHELNFHARVRDRSFTAQASVFSADKIAVHSGGTGAVTGQEV
jgi:hypothetical protein